MKIGFLGAGNMAGAFIAGLSNALCSNNISVFDIDKAKSDALSDKYGVKSLNTGDDVFKSSDIIFIALKPQHVLSAIENASPFLTNDKTIVSIAAGMSLSALRRVIGGKCSVIRIMPNTPAMCKQGMFAVAAESDRLYFDEVLSMLSQLGEYAVIPEELISASTGLQGSGPAYVFMFIDALVRGGVAAGLDQNTALQMAIQTVKGSAELVKATGEAPDDLKIKVCSPGGTTIEGVHVLEDAGFYETVSNAVVAAANKAEKMSVQ
ncbi:MAG: pyrroline-5-carboxylate reductase [Clostridiales bacterium]|nr:pyrroline-5-carboxylate reductase [Clostridiales bacterium]